MDSASSELLNLEERTVWLWHIKTGFETVPRDHITIVSAYDKWYVEVQLAFTSLHPIGVDAGRMPSAQYRERFKCDLNELHAYKPWPDSDGTVEQKAKHLYEWCVQWWRLHPCVAVQAVRLQRGNTEDCVTYLGEVIPLVVRHGQLCVRDSTVTSHAAQKSESGGATEGTNHGREFSRAPTGCCGGDAFGLG